VAAPAETVRDTGSLTTSVIELALFAGSESGGELSTISDRTT
jgi:hypothetical protein